MSASHVSLPNFCHNGALLMSLITAQLVLSCVWLLAAETHSLNSYGLWTLYVQTWALLVCAALCHLRGWLQRLPVVAGVSGVLALVVALLLVVEWLASLLLVFDVGSIWRAEVAYRVVSVALMTLLMLRIFALLEVLDTRSQAEAQSRLQALQAKIQPHFLFNSLNTISELTATQPDKAEEAIQALAMLFRVSLEDSDDVHSLAQELKLCERFVALESWRFESPPTFDQTINVADPSRVMVPKLLLQPLYENALKYGIAAGLAPADAVIELSIQETRSLVSIKLRNTFAQASDTRAGHGVALDNIRERLWVLYHDQQSVKTKIDVPWFEVMITLPKSVQ